MSVPFRNIEPPTLPNYWLLHRETTQSVCVADSYFVVNVAIGEANGNSRTFTIK